MRVYLGGPINGCNDVEAHGWRHEAVVALWANGHTESDPMDHDYRGAEDDIDPAALVGGDLLALAYSDALLANCWKPSFGTAMEIVYAARGFAGRPPIRVLIVVPDGQPVSPWLAAHGEIHRTVASAIQALGAA